MIHFGTGGWRAIIGDEFTKANIQLLSHALARIMLNQGVTAKGLCIGYDRRFLSLEGAQWAAEVFAGAGISCKVLDREAPTPLVMFSVKALDMNYGMAITASHNPALYNGIKIFTKGGRDADELITADIETYSAELCNDFIPIIAYEEGLRSGIIEEIDPFNDYIDSILCGIDLEKIKYRRLKVVLDPMYGVSRTSLQTILLTARCDVDVIHERHDTLFGGRLPAPNMDTMKSLMTYVTEHGCDLGIATDGDADRIGVVDDNGNFLHPNCILTLLYYYLLEHKGWYGPVVRNLCTTHLLDRVAKSFGQICYEVPVGFKYISGKMLETDAIIGGESSGGLTVRGHIQGKDGIYAAALLVEMISVTGKQISELYTYIVDRYGLLYMEERSYQVTPQRKHQLYIKMLEEKQLPTFSQEIESVSYLDGCKVLFKDGGWIVVRFSGTEPLLRICAETNNECDAIKAVETLEAFLML